MQTKLSWKQIEVYGYKIQKRLQECKEGMNKEGGKKYLKNPCLCLSNT